MTRNVAVVGSGFAAWGVLKALLDMPGVKLHVFDIGLTQKQPWQTDRAVANAKMLDGSYFCYGINDPAQSVQLESERMCSSHALGGHSRVYSGAVLYPRYSDIRDWPVAARPGSEDYRAILADLPILHDHDDLESVFPLMPAETDLDDAAEPHSDSSVLGYSRIATEINLQNADERSASPSKAFSVDQRITAYAAASRIRYLNRCYVTHVEVLSDGVKLHYCRDQVTQSGSFDAVFLGAGCVNTTAIVDRSLAQTGTREYTVLSPLGVIHGFLKLPSRPDRSAVLRRRSGLPEYFLEVRSPLTDGAWAHTQLTAINEQIRLAIQSRLPGILHPLIRLAAGCFYFALSHRRSDGTACARIRSTVETDRQGRVQQRVQIFENDKPPCLSVMKAVRRAVRRHWQRLHMIPIPFSASLADFFRQNRLGGWHFGATLPMRDTPTKPTECTADGELSGFPGVFVADSSAFTSVPANTVALLTAAHGHRVARKWYARQQTKGEQHGN
jgi:hypothetical protein